MSGNLLQERVAIPKLKLPPMVVYYLDLNKVQLYYCYSFFPPYIVKNLILCKIIIIFLSKQII